MGKNSGSAGTRSGWLRASRVDPIIYSILSNRRHRFLHVAYRIASTRSKLKDKRRARPPDAEPARDGRAGAGVSSIALRRPENQEMTEKHTSNPPSPKISVVIPAFNEAESIALVLDALPSDMIHEVIVANNASQDDTARIAGERGARVVDEARKGYGWACLAGIAAADDPDIFVFLDADFSDHPDELGAVVAPIVDGRADMVIGARVAAKREPGAMLPQARFGNMLATTLIRLIWGYRYTDLGPFRAITAEGLRKINMRDKTFGWTVEMQIKALREGLRVTEVPVSYRKRIGVSKITGTVSGTLGAGYKILWTIAKYSISGRRG